MPLRRFWFVSLLAPLTLGGCGTVSAVRTAFVMPVAPTPSPQELARARKTHAFDSLSQSLAKLDSKTLGHYFSSGSKTPTKATPPRVPLAVGSSSEPGRALANDLARGGNIPLAPRQVAVSFPPVLPLPSLGSAPLSGEATRILGPRTILTSRSTTDGGNTALSDFLRGWATRDSLRRADNELLGRRALEDRIALQSRSTLPTLDLSLVSPETQLELSNLRLQLIPLLSIPAAQRANAQANIDAIEKRLNQIWSAETARQNALLQQSLVDIPARLRKEGEQSLALSTQSDAVKNRVRLDQVRQEFESHLRPLTLPALGIAQQPAIAPDTRKIHTALNTPTNSAGNSGRRINLTALPGDIGITRRGGGISSHNAQIVAERDERVWQAATR